MMWYQHPAIVMITSTMWVAWNNSYILCLVFTEFFTLLIKQGAVTYRMGRIENGIIKTRAKVAMMPQYQYSTEAYFSISPTNKGSHFYFDVRLSSGLCRYADACQDRQPNAQQPATHR